MAKKNSYDLAASSRRSWKTELKRDWVVYLLFLPIIIYEVVLHYLPMFGIVMAFQDYNVIDGYFHSPWVGMKHFIDLFSGEDFLQAIRKRVQSAAEDDGSCRRFPSEEFAQYLCALVNRIQQVFIVQHRHPAFPPSNFISPWSPVLHGKQDTCCKHRHNPSPSS